MFYVKVTVGSEKVAGGDFSDIDKANLWVEKHTKNKTCGEVGDFVCTVTPIAEQYEKDQRRKAVFKRRSIKRKLAANLIDFLEDHITENSLTPTQETTFNNAIASVKEKLRNNKPEDVKAAIENKEVGQLFTQELKDLLIEEFERFGL